MNVQQGNGQPRILGSYQLLHRLAQGPEGEIWQAHKTQSRRQMIIRLLPPIPANTQTYQQQFNQVMRIISTLKHEHILPIYDFGAAAVSRDEVSCYFVLPFIDGVTTLQARLQANATLLPPIECLYYLRQAALALDFAHGQQILHLGLTPANILLNRDLLMLTDFCLTPLLHRLPSRSRPALNINPYLAPEQVMKGNQPAVPTPPISAASDLYSLAVIAYQLFTGRFPVQGGSSQPVEESLLERLARPTLSPVIESIFAKALSSQPNERYTSCNIFVQALEHAWQDMPLAPALDPDKTLVAPWTRQRLEQELASMRTFIKPAEPDRRTKTALPNIPPSTPRPVESSAEPTFISRATLNQQVERAAEPTFISRAAPEQQVERAAEPTFISRHAPDQTSEGAANPTFISQPSPNQPHEGAVTPVYISLPSLDQPHEGAGEATYISHATPDQMVPASPLLQGKISRRTLMIGGAAAAVVLVGGGTTLAVTSAWKGHSKQTSTASVRPVHFTPGQAVARLTAHTDAVTNVVWSPDGRYLASAGLDKFAMLWDLAATLRQPSSPTHILNQPARKWDIYSSGIDTDGLNWTPDGHSLVTITSESPSLLNPFSSTSKPRMYNDQAVDKNLLAFSCATVNPQNTTLAAIDGSLHRNHQVALWHFNTLANPYTILTYTDANQFIGDNSIMFVIGWSSDGTQLAGITSLNEVVVWNVASHAVKAVIKLPARVKDPEHAQVISITLVWSPTNPQRLAVSNIDTVAIVDVQQKKVIQQLYIDDKEALNSAKNPQNPDVVFPNVVGITWPPDGRYIAASYARSSKVFVWDLQAKNAKVTHGLTIQSSFFPQNSSTTSGTQTPLDISWSPDGRYLATGADDHSITIWQVDTEKTAPVASQTGKAFSPLVS